jgi:GDP-L-fucose synthase
MEKRAKIYIAGIHGMAGSAIARSLRAEGYQNIIGHPSNDLDLTNQSAVFEMFRRERPDYVVLAAAKVGGIIANRDNPADFIFSNLAIQTNVFQAAHQYRVKKLLFLASSCIYPKLATQPIPESALLTGPLEPTNQPYAIAKIAGIEMARAYSEQYSASFISCMPCNLYGPGDNYHPENSHVIPGLIRRIHEAKERGDKQFTLWGTGSPLREFLHVDDLASACLLLLQEYLGREAINIGSSQEVTIQVLAHKICSVVGFRGGLTLDPSKPDGTRRKVLDSSKMRAMGWEPKTSLEDGLKQAYEDFLTSKRK